MDWANAFITRLQAGQPVEFRPRGHSMKGRVDNRELVRVTPIGAAGVAVDDIVLCRVGGRSYLHLVSAIQGERYQISNNRGHVNGWTTIHKIYGKVTAFPER